MIRKQIKNIIMNYRYWLLAVLTGAALAGIISWPDDSLSSFSWWRALIWSKAVGFVALYIISRLIGRWEKGNTIPELTRLINNN